MKIGLDLHILERPCPTGVERAWKCLALALLRREDAGRFVLYSRDPTNLGVPFPVWAQPVALGGKERTSLWRETRLAPALRQDGMRVTRLVRTRPASATGDAWWNPEAGQLDPPGPDGFDAVVHLAGEGIAAGRWTEARKARIRDSRVQGTTLLASAIARESASPT